jgi:magnesium-transporting ATPase (P-type)
MSLSYGESLPSSKQHLFIAEKDIPVSERINCVFMGTTVHGEKQQE